MDDVISSNETSSIEGVENSPLNISFQAGKKDLKSIFKKTVDKLTKYKHIKSHFKQKRKSLTLQDNTVIYSASNRRRALDRGSP